MGLKEHQGLLVLRARWVFLALPVTQEMLATQGLRDCQVVKVKAEIMGQ